MASYTYELPDHLRDGHGQAFSSLVPKYSEERGQILFDGSRHNQPLDLSQVTGGELDGGSVEKLEEFVGILYQKAKLFDLLAKEEMGPERDRLLRNVVEETLLNRRVIQDRNVEITGLAAQLEEASTEKNQLISMLYKEREETKKINAELIKTSNANSRRAKWYRNQLVKKNSNILRNIVVHYFEFTREIALMTWKRNVF